MLLLALVFGLIAWVVPMLGLRVKVSRQVILVTSLTAAAITILIVLLEINNRVVSGDIVYLLDTLKTMVLGVMAMLVGTILSNTVYVTRMR